MLTRVAWTSLDSHVVLAHDQRSWPLPTRSYVANWVPFSPAIPITSYHLGRIAAGCMAINIWNINAMNNALTLSQRASDDDDLTCDGRSFYNYILEIKSCHPVLNTRRKRLEQSTCRYIRYCNTIESFKGKLKTFSPSPITNDINLFTLWHIALHCITLHYTEIVERQGVTVKAYRRQAMSDMQWRLVSQV